MRNNTLFIVALVAVVMAGCSKEHMRPDFGNATAINIAAQTANPDATEQSVTATNAVDGQKMEKAVQRYRADKGESSRGKLLDNIISNTN